MTDFSAPVTVKNAYRTFKWTDEQVSAIQELICRASYHSSAGYLRLEEDETNDSLDRLVHVLRNSHVVSLLDELVNHRRKEK